MNGRHFGLIAALAGALTGGGADPWSFRARKKPRWQVLGHESEAAYLKRTPQQTEKAECPCIDPAPVTVAIERLATQAYSTNAVAPVVPFTPDSILETMRSIPRVEPLRVTTRQFATLKRHYAAKPVLQPNPLAIEPHLDGLPVIIDDENPTVPEVAR